MNWYLWVSAVVAALFWIGLVLMGADSDPMVVAAYCLTLGLATAILVGLLWPLAVLILLITAVAHA